MWCRGTHMSVVQMPASGAAIAEPYCMAPSAPPQTPPLPTSMVPAPGAPPFCALKADRAPWPLKTNWLLHCLQWVGILCSVSCHHRWHQLHRGRRTVRPTALRACAGTARDCAHMLTFVPSGKREPGQCGRGRPQELRRGVRRSRPGGRRAHAPDTRTGS